MITAFFGEREIDEWKKDGDKTVKLSFPREG